MSRADLQKLVQQLMANTVDYIWLFFMNRQELRKQRSNASIKRERRDDSPVVVGERRTKLRRVANYTDEAIDLTVDD